MIAVCIVGLLAFAPTAPLLARRPLAASRCVTMAEIAAADVKSLRQKTGAGMMDCKVALKECDGDMDKAADMLRAKGLAAAGKRSSKATSEGLIEVYVHTGSRLGVMVELNCETDFVAKRPEFAALAKSVAMQIAASPTVEFVSVSDIPPEVIEAERVLEMQSEDLAGKPDEIKAKMVEGRLQKILKTKCLMETAYIKDPTQTMEVVVKSAISTLGENIKVARFSRMELGA